jgi:hypothetical protein
MSSDFNASLAGSKFAGQLSAVAKPEFYLPSQYHWSNSKFGIHQTSVVSSSSQESAEVQRVYDTNLNCSVTSHLYRESNIGGGIDILRAVNYGLTVLSEKYYKVMERNGLMVTFRPDFPAFKNRFKELCWVSYSNSDFAMEVNRNAFAYLDKLMRDKDASLDDLSSAFEFFVSTQPFEEDLFRKFFCISSDVFNEACVRTLGRLFAIETAPIMTALSAKEKALVERETARFLSSRKWIIRQEQ